MFLVRAFRRWIADHMMQQAAVNGSLHQPGFAEDAATKPPGHRTNDMLSDRERSDVEPTVTRQLPAAAVVPGNLPDRDLPAGGIRRNQTPTRQHRRDAPRPDARPVASRCLRIRLYFDENFP